MNDPQTVFKDNDPAYIAWTRQHPDGFVLHHKGQDYSLHHVECPAIYDLLGGVRLTAREKRCAVSRRELVEYARARTGRTPIGCEQCGS